MHCKNCHYALWRLPARTCPECGTPFAPSQFEFRPNAVKFCCPHCAQEYYGTSPSGHLEPRNFACVRCAQQIDMDEMVLLPASGVNEDDAEVEHRNWPHRARVGLVRSWFISIGQSMAMPGKLIGAAVPDRVGEAWWFATFTQMVIYGFYALTTGLLFGVLMLTMGGARGGPGAGAASMAMFGVCGGFALAGLIITQVYFLISALVAHALLRLTGPTAFSIGRTMQCAFYASGPMVLSAVPCVGQYTAFIGVVWATVSLALMLVSGQRVSGGRATLAAVATPIATLLISAGLIALMVFSTPGPGPWKPRRAGSAGTMSTGVHTVAPAIASRLNSGRTYTHPVQLLIDHDIMGYDLIASGSSLRSPKQVSIGFSNAQDVMFLPPNQQQTLVTNVTASLPAGAGEVVMGDLVFPLVGSVNDPELWVVIVDPKRAGPAGSLQPLVVGKRSGQVVRLNVDIAQEYAKQNARRAQAGLAPLTIPPTGGTVSTPSEDSGEDEEP